MSEFLDKERHCPHYIICWMAIALSCFYCFVQYLLTGSLGQIGFLFAYLVINLSFFRLWQIHDQQAGWIYAVFFIVAQIFFWASRIFFYAEGIPEASINPSDPVTFARVGWDYARYWDTGITSNPYIIYGKLMTRAYYVYNGIIYWILGEKVFWAPVMINISVGSTAAVLCLMVARLFLARPSAAVIAGVLFAIDPRMIMFSASNFKTAWLVLGELGVVYAALRIKRSNLWGMAALVLSCSFFLFVLRKPLLLVVVFAFAVMALNWMANKLAISSWAKCAVGLAVIFVILYIPHPVSKYIHHHVDSMITSISFQKNADSGSLYRLIGDRSLLASPQKIPLALAASYLGPLPPWRLDTSWLSIVTRFGTWWIHLLTPFVLVALWNLKKGRHDIRHRSLLLTLLVGILLSVIIPTRGTPVSYRYLVTLQPFLLILAAAGFDRISTNYARYIMLLYIVFMATITSGYFIIKHII